MHFYSLKANMQPPAGKGWAAHNVHRQALRRNKNTFFLYLLPFFSPFFQLCCNKGDKAVSSARSLWKTTRKRSPETWSLLAKEIAWMKQCAHSPGGDGWEIEGKWEIDRASGVYNGLCVCVCVCVCFPIVSSLTDPLDSLYALMTSHKAATTLSPSLPVADCS